MAQTTTAVNACDVVVSLDDGVGALTDISGSSNQVDMEFSINIGEWRSFGSDYPVRRTCGKDASFTLIFVYSETDDEARDIVMEWYFVYDGASRSLQVDVPDGTVGSER